jgi:hypothetical protein
VAQINIPIDEYSWVVLQVLRTVRDESVPALVTPVVERHLRKQARDPQVKAAVDALLVARSKRTARVVTPIGTHRRGPGA